MSKKMCPTCIALGAVGALALLFVPVVSEKIIAGVNVVRSKVNMSVL